MEVRLKDWGVESIEVSDNGSGVAPSNYQASQVAPHVVRRHRRTGRHSRRPPFSPPPKKKQHTQALTLKHHTSKISGFGDLRSVASFGFRGEALSALCEISGHFEVLTRRPDEALGARLVYDRCVLHLFAVCCSAVA